MIEIITNYDYNFNKLFENGEKMIEKYYKNGEKDGHWIEWSKDGEKKNEKHYKVGKK